MNLSKLQKEMFAAKKEFVADLSNMLRKTPSSGVTGVDYEVYVTPDDDNSVGDFYEVIVMHYAGGAIAVRNVTCDSHTAILAEAARLASGGHYGEVANYRNILQKVWKKVV